MLGTIFNRIAVYFLGSLHREQRKQWPDEEEERAGLTNQFAGSYFMLLPIFEVIKASVIKPLEDDHVRVKKEEIAIFYHAERVE